MTAKKLFSEYVSKNILAMLGLSCYILADTLFISASEGAEGLAALNLVLPIYSLIFGIGSMIGTGAATRFSILRAKGDEKADLYFSNACSFALIAGAVFMLAGHFFPHKIIALMGGDSEMIAVGRDYTRIFMLFAPFFILNYIFSAFVRNDGSPSIAMISTLAGSFSNIFLDYLFMFPMGMGMKGAALATGLSPVIGIAVSSIHFFTKTNTIRFRLGLPSVKLLLRSCLLGISAFVGELSSGITTAVFNFLILGLSGNTGVAAYGVVANLALVAVAFFNGIAQGSQPLISRFYGEGKHNEMRKIYRLGTLTAITASVLIVSAVFLFTPQLVALFNSEGSAELAGYAHEGLRIYFIGFVLAGANIVSSGYFSASERPAAASAVSFSRGIISIVICAFVLSSLLGMKGVWMAFPAAELVTAAISVICNMRKKTKS